MAKISDILLKMSLFEGIRPEELEAILKCLRAKKVTYSKNEFIINMGDRIDSFGIVISGTVQILKEDISGRQVILSALTAGDTFAEVFVCAGIKKSPVAVMAATEAEVVFIDYGRVVHTCNNACEFHSRLIQNMLKVLAQKNLFMNNKITYLTLKGMRQKIASYLLSQIEKTGKDRFEIPYSRAELADFLNVDRSAMSRELSRMKKEGLIDFNRNTFSVLDKQALCDLV